MPQAPHAVDPSCLEAAEINGQVVQAIRILPFLAIPSATGMHSYMQDSAIRSVAEFYPGHIRVVGVQSLLNNNFNNLYAAALNCRKKGVTHFVMLHDDICPEDPDPDRGWCDTLIATMIIRGLGAICAASPIKNDQGEVSCAIDDPDPFKIRRMKIGDFEGKTITTREEPRLLINTGCMAIDITKPWATKIMFRSKDYIRYNKATDTYEAICEPEDWNLSKQLRALGVPFGCTGKIRINHLGTKTYTNWTPAPEDKRQTTDEALAKIMRGMPDRPTP